MAELGPTKIHGNHDVRGKSAAKSFVIEGGNPQYQVSYSFQSVDGELTAGLHGKNAHVTLHENGKVAISNNAAGDSTIDFTDKYIQAFKDFESEQKVTGKKGVYDGTQRVFSHNNRNITSDIDDSSSSKYASALAVKTVADHTISDSMAIEKLFVHGGWKQRFALTKNGRLYGFGQSDDYSLGQGEGQAENQFGFVLINLPYSTHEVADVFMGHQTSYFVLYNRENNLHEIWGCGNASHGALGGQAANRFSPTPIIKEVTEYWKPIDFCYGRTPMFYVRDKNRTKIMAFGANAYGRTGDGNTSAITADSGRLIALPENIAAQKVKKIFSMGGWYGCTFLVTTDNKLFACGYNGQGQLGIGSTTNTSTWKKVNLSTGIVAKIEEIRGGYGYHTGGGESAAGFTFIRTNTGELYFAGDGANYAAGRGTHTDSTTFVQVATNVVELYSGGHYGSHIMKQGNTYRVWGMNHNNRWAANAADLSRPRDVNLSGLSGPKCNFQCSGSYTPYLMDQVFWNERGMYCYFGTNRYGAGGYGLKDKEASYKTMKVRQVPIDQGDQVIGMYTAQHYNDQTTYCLTRTGKLYACGYGLNNFLPKTYGSQSNASNSTWQLLN